MEKSSKSFSDHLASPWWVTCFSSMYIFH
jgi:hypothetical protein